MQIDKQQIIGLLKNRGDHNKASEADAELPKEVDTNQHSDLLAKLGLDPKDLIGGLRGKLGGL